MLSRTSVKHEYLKKFERIGRMFNEKEEDGGPQRTGFEVLDDT